ncbi:MAG: formylglycine-generating enzyme family protein [Planctomycetes bacterium]|nr:formylglycine-generating enzyme family protein [Planctomycetota bacterium]
MNVRAIPLGGALLVAAGGFVGLWYASQALQETEPEGNRDSALSRAKPAPMPAPDAAVIERLRRETEQREAERREAERRERFGPEIGDLVAIGKSAQSLYEYVKDLGGGVTLRLVLIPEGLFMMGSPESGPGRWSDESPQHRVNVKSFLMGKYEVTQRQWQAVMGSNPSLFQNAGLNAPVEWVSWDDCREFCEKTGLRLPSEAEWEYACRAGTTTRWSFGDGESALGEHAWYGANSGGTTHPVGQKKPNGWGLYDMHGNVCEWCEDWYHDSYGGAPADGSAWISNKSAPRVLRGGSWDYTDGFARSAGRDGGTPGDRDHGNGFRVALSPVLSEGR